MKKIFSLLVAISILVAFAAVMPVSAAEEIVRAGETILFQWDGDLEPVVSTSTSGTTVSYSGLKFTSKKTSNGGASVYAVDLNAEKFTTSNASVLTYETGSEPVHTTYVTTGVENENSYIMSNWYLLKSTPRGAVSVRTYLTEAKPYLDYSFSFKNISSNSGERRFTYALGTTEKGTDFLNLQVSSASTGIVVTDLSSSTVVVTDTTTTYNTADWNDFEILGSFKNGEKASFGIYMNDTLVATVESQQAYTFGNELYISNISLQNGSSPSGGALKSIRTTYYDNITVSTFGEPLDVEFDLDGGQLNSDKTEWAVGDTLPTTPTLPGYTFAGWTLNNAAVTTVTESGTYVAVWTYNAADRAPISRPLNTWTNMLQADAYGIGGSFAPGGSYASLEGNVAEFIDNEESAYNGTVRVHAPQVNMNYIHKVRTYLNEDVSVLKYNYEVLIPNDDYKDALRTFTLIMAKYDTTAGSSNADRFVEQEDVVLNFENGKVTVPASNGNIVNYIYEGSADVKYGEWMNVSVEVHYVQNGRCDYLVKVDDITVLTAIGKYNRDIALAGIRQVKYTQAVDENHVAIFDTYYRNAELKVENRPIQIIKGADKITVKAGYTGVTGGTLIVGIYNAGDRLLTASVDGVVTEDGLTTVEIPVDTSVTGHYYSGTNAVKAYYWDLNTLEPLTDVVEMPSLYNFSD